MIETSKKRCFGIDTVIIVYLFIYGGISLLFLTDFPFIHSDESWLAGLSRNMMDTGSFSVTEPFFNLKPRYPHAIKILFHSMQIGFISLFGYSVWSVRLFSLICGIAALYLFYRLAKKLLKEAYAPFFITVIFSLDIQFIYASHFARQEILILVMLLACLFLFFKTDNPCTMRTTSFAGIVTGLSIGLHPNSFLIACSMGSLFAADWIKNHRQQKAGENDRAFFWNSKKPLLNYIGITGIFAMVFVGISFIFDPQFLSHYLSNGINEFGIDASFGTRFSECAGFFTRLFQRSGGTYYVADLRFSFLLFSLVLILAVFYYLVMRKEEKVFSGYLFSLVLASFGIVFGIFLIGRFSQLSILFLFPFGWLLTSLILQLFEKKLRILLYCFLFLITVIGSLKEIAPYLKGESYSGYLLQIAEYVKPEEKVLGNLNMDFYFENGSLFDYRNLPYAMEDPGEIGAYVEENKIEYIFYSEELNYYYENRPYYNVIYGNTMFVPALKDYCRQECKELGSFKNSRYAPRLLTLIGDEKYASITVYRTKFAGYVP